MIGSFLATSKKSYEIKCGRLYHIYYLFENM